MFVVIMMKRKRNNKIIIIGGGLKRVALLLCGRRGGGKSSEAKIPMLQVACSCKEQIGGHLMKIKSSKVNTPISSHAHATRPQIEVFLLITVEKVVENILNDHFGMSLCCPARLLWLKARVSVAMRRARYKLRQKYMRAAYFGI